MKKNPRYIIIVTFVLVSLVLAYFITDFILSGNTGAGIIQSGDAPASAESETAAGSQPAASIQGIPESADALPPESDEPVETLVALSVSERQTKVVNENKPEYEPVNMRLHPEKNSAFEKPSYQTVEIAKGQTLWSIASKTGSKNPWRWIDILRENHKKSRYLLFDDKLDFWFVIVPAGIDLKVPEKKSSIRYDRAAPKKYAVQIASYSVPEREQAYDFTERLNRDGYFAYTYLTDRKIKTEANATPQKYYRVRIGFFESKEEGVEVAEDILIKYPGDTHNYFISEPSFKELEGRLFNYGIQLSMPYAVELQRFSSQRGAVSAVRKMKAGGKYPYLIRHRAGSKRYAVRVGFFPSEPEARKYIEAQRRDSGSAVYNQARVIKLSSVMETSMGQKASLYLPY